MSKPGHFVTGDFRPHGVQLPNDAAAIVFDNTVPVVVNCVVVNPEGRMLLVKRKFDPHPDWWVLGDIIMLPGESLGKTAQRVLEQTAGLKVENDKRFRFIDFNSCVWGKRKEPLQENGCHFMAFTMSIIVTDEEVAKITLTEDFSDPTWVPPQNVVLKPPFPLHQAVRKIAQAFFLSVQKIGT